MVASETSGAGSTRFAPTVTIGAVAAAHFVSHFFMVAFAPVLPLVAAEFDIGFTQAGLVFSTLALTSGLGQPVAGILVDRFGAHRILIVGLFMQVAGILAMGLTTSFVQLLPFAAIAGLGNSVYHPADLSILSRRIDGRRLGRAFATHGIAGSAGFALSPVVIGWLAFMLGWRDALVAIGMFGLLIGTALVLLRSSLRIAPERAGRPGSDGTETAAAGISLLQVFRLPVVVAGFATFTLVSLFGAAVTSFGVTAFGAYGYTLATAGLLVALFQGGAIVGVLVGGAVAERTSHQERVAMIGVGIGAVFIVGIAFAEALPAALLLFLAMSGFAFGIIQPSRDILLRAAAPPERLGTAIGAAYSGLDFGALIAPLIYGPLLDMGRADLIYVASGALMALAIPCLRHISRSRRAGTAA